MDGCFVTISKYAENVPVQARLRSSKRYASKRSRRSMRACLSEGAECLYRRYPPKQQGVVRNVGMKHAQQQRYVNGFAYDVPSNFCDSWYHTRVLCGAIQMQCGGSIAMSLPWQAPRVPIPSNHRFSVYTTVRATSLAWRLQTVHTLRIGQSVPPARVLVNGSETIFSAHDGICGDRQMRRDCFGRLHNGLEGEPDD